MAEPLGRPTKLTKELLEKAQGYLATCEDEVHTTDKGSVSYVEVNLPSIVGLARYIGVHKDTVYEWRKVNTDFSDLVKEIEAEQEIRLINKGLGGLYTSKALGAMLTKHGYREGTDVTSDGDKIVILPNEIHGKRDTTSQPSTDSE